MYLLPLPAQPDFGNMFVVNARCLKKTKHAESVRHRLCRVVDVG